MSSLHQQRGLTLPRLQHVSLPIPTDGQEQVRAFYGRVLGFVEKPVPQSLTDRGLVWFAVGDGEMELHFIPDPNHPANPEESRHICFEVPDLETYRQALAAAGYEINEAGPIFNRPRFFTLDPFGNKLELTTILGSYLATE
ncbi:VOC family protein [Tengunoibacter tsumagoiensis]|uniref:Glyoxalase n=1 Tax=Tengunoibacter tsumagoiensis TaxID=2014871 RepID=A0A401ZXS1_9CHLR|nr:VOC family protein [Tengunoibacter tsumagoiensis]GCE11656.1 glyoxalase [Tengunoibacter tsumagoiensis]